MKPLNLDNKPCSPISSNCVIWQGPDIPCIKLCTGDTVSDVIFKLATELCTIMDQLNISNYDLSCFNLAACPPQTFQELIQFLIDQICAAQGITVTDGKIAGCPDCVVSVAPCFQTGNQTTMQLVDYVQMIGERVCSIVDQISVINNQIQNLQVRVEILENTPPPVFTLPSIATNCLAPYMSGAVSAPIDQVLDTLLNDPIFGYCQLIDATGLPADLISAVASQCISATDPSLANPGDTMGTAYFPNWVNTPTTVADAITNLWLTICDIYNATPSLSVVDTNTVNLTYAGGILQADVQDTGWVDLLGFDYIPSNNIQGKPQVRRIGNILHFRGTVIVPLNNGGSALTWGYVSNTDTYLLRTDVTPFQGLGGVYCNPNGSVVFNYSGVGTASNSVIPTSVLPAGFAIDSQYQNPAGWKIGQRIIPINGFNSTFLSTLFSQVITPNGNLVLGLIKDTEASWVSGRGGNNSFDTSHLNYIISHVTSGESAPQFKTGTNIVHSLAGGGTSDLNLDFPAAYTYPFSCNANDEQEVGGFFVRLDGLTAFISPCEDLIPTPTPCP